MFFPGAAVPIPSNAQNGLMGSAKAIVVTSGSQTLYLDPSIELPLGYDEHLSATEVLTVRYSDIKLGGQASAGDFAWTPPAGAKPIGAADSDSKFLPSGSAAPAPIPSAIDGSKIDLSKTYPAHKATLIYFWKGAPPTDVTFLKDAFAQAGAQRLAIVAIEMSPKTVEPRGLPFPVVVDQDGSIAKRFGVQAPAEYLVGSDGNVAAHFQGFDPGDIIKLLRQRGFRI